MGYNTFMNYDRLLDQAKHELAQNPFDIAHDYAHHLSVYENCIQIVSSEKLKVDLNALALAAWLHDYQRDKEKARNEFVRKIVKENKITREFAEKVIKIINSHSYGNEQLFEEQKVLFDADKLEYVSVSRLNLVILAVETGKLSREAWQRYGKAWLERTHPVHNLLHYEISKKLYAKRAQEFLSFIKHDTRLNELSDIMI